MAWKGSPYESWLGRPGYRWQRSSVAFVARAAVTPTMAKIVQDGYPRVQRLIVGPIGEAASADAELEASTLLALADGLTLQVLLGQLGRDEIGRPSTHTCGRGRQPLPLISRRPRRPLGSPRTRSLRPRWRAQG